VLNYMSKKIPTLSEVELQIILDSDAAFPNNITELDFFHQIQTNKKIKWDVNPFILEEKQVRIMLDANQFNKWKSIQRTSQLIGLFIVYWCLSTWTIDMLLLLAIIPFTMAALPHLLFVVCMGLIIGVKLYFNLTIPLFWVIIFFVAASFTLNKIFEDRAKQTIIQQGLSNWQNFWKYYSNKIIFPALSSNIDELQYLLNRYPELIL
jgi:hypothetical protein